MSIDDMQFGFIFGKGTTDDISSCDKFKKGTILGRRSCTMHLTESCLR